MTETRRHLLLASLTPFGLFVLLGVAVDLGWLGTARVDAPSAGIRAWAVDRPWSEGTLLLVEKAFATQGLTIATLVLAGLLLLTRRVRAAVLVVAVMLATRELTAVTKDLFGRDRPAWQDSDLFHHAGSYPSGHAAGTAALGALTVVVVLLAGRRPVVQRVVSAAVVLLVVVVCADRLLLGRHYVTDLVGGVLLAVGLVLLGMALLDVQVGPRPRVAAGTQKGRHLAGDAPSEVARRTEPAALSRSA